MTSFAQTADHSLPPSLA